MNKQYRSGKTFTPGKDLIRAGRGRYSADQSWACCFSQMNQALYFGGGLGYVLASLVVNPPSATGPGAPTPVSEPCGRRPQQNPVFYPVTKDGNAVSSGPSARAHTLSFGGANERMNQ